MSKNKQYMSHTGSKLQVLFMQFFFEDIQQLHTKETWIVETDDESGGTTQLVTFKSLIWTQLIMKFISDGLPSYQLLLLTLLIPTHQ